MTPSDFEVFARPIPEPLLLLSDAGRILAANPSAVALGLARGTELMERVSEPAGRIEAYLQRCAKTGHMLPGPLGRIHGTTAEYRFEGALLGPRRENQPAVLILRLKPRSAAVQQFRTLNEKIDRQAKEIAERRRVENVFEQQRRALELIAAGAPLEITLEKVVRILQDHSTDGTLGSVMLLEDSGERLRIGAAPDLPEGYSRVIDGLKIGSSAGSCGTAAYSKQEVIVSDTLSDPLWADYRHLAGFYHLRAAWSIPLLSATAEVLGTFDIYYRTPRAPSRRDAQLVVMLARTAVLAIERKREAEERTRLFDETKRARREAERANRAKDNFLAVVSHELRTPLTSILGWSRMLSSETLESRDGKRALEIIERNASAQAKLVDDLLNLSAIVSGKLQMEWQDIDVLQMLHRAVDSARPAAEAKSISIEKDILEIPRVQADLGRLEQVVLNLLSNAVKFTPTGGNIRIKARAEDCLEIEITDTGIGIDPKFLTHVFDRFRQADDSTTRVHGGLGLGLSIAREIVELHGGEIRAESPGPGRGATFTVRIPLSAGGRLPPAGPAETAPVQRTEWALAGVRILVVEDEVDSRELLAQILTSSGAHITAAESVTEAFLVIERADPDVVVSDLQMPRRDGYELVQKLRARQLLTGIHTPAVAVTAYSDERHRNQALACGFEAFISKPIDPAPLISTIVNLLSRARAAGARPK